MRQVSNLINNGQCYVYRTSILLNTLLQIYEYNNNISYYMLLLIIYIVFRLFWERFQRTDCSSAMRLLWIIIIIIITYIVSCAYNNIINTRLCTSMHNRENITFHPTFQQYYLHNMILWEHIIIFIAQALVRYDTRNLLDK